MGLTQVLAHSVSVYDFLVVVYADTNDVALTTIPVLIRTIGK